MRPELNRIALIERYLRDELSPTEKHEFEAYLKKHPEFQQEIDLQRDLMEGVKRIGQKKAIKKAAKSYKLTKSLWRFGLGTVVLVAASAAVLLITDPNASESWISSFFNNESTTEETQYDDDRYLEKQVFQLNAAQDTVITTQAGIIISIPQNAFQDASGKAITGPIDFEVKEALDPLSIWKLVFQPHQMAKP